MTTNSTITITWGEQIETHRTMEKIGQIANSGFSHDDLQKIAKWFMDNGANVILYDLNTLLGDHANSAEKAYLLIVRGGVHHVLNDNTTYDDLFNELLGLPYDHQKFMYGRVVDSKARRCICIADFDQECDYSGYVKKGTVVNFNNLPILQDIRNKLNTICEFPENYLLAEGNHYYDVNTCGIGYHGDTERRYVIGMRFGQPLSLHYNWFQQGNPIGDKFSTILQPGDIYFMGDKTTGYDWKRKIIPTLRHAAGSRKFTTLSN